MRGPNGESKGSSMGRNCKIGFRKGKNVGRVRVNWGGEKCWRKKVLIAGATFEKC